MAAAATVLATMLLLVLESVLNGIRDKRATDSSKFLMAEDLLSDYATKCAAADRGYYATFSLWGIRVAARGEVRARWWSTVALLMLLLVLLMGIVRVVRGLVAALLRWIRTWVLRPSVAVVPSVPLRIAGVVGTILSTCLTVLEPTSRWGSVAVLSLRWTETTLGSVGV